MHWLRRLFTTLLAVALAATATAWVADRTVWSPAYLNNKVTTTDLATDLSTGLPDLATKFGGNQAATRAVLVAVLTPAYAQHQLGLVIPAFTAAYRHDGPAPKLNLTDLAGQLSALGTSAPAGLIDRLSQPISLIPDSFSVPLKDFGHATGLASLWGPLASLVLILLIIAVAGRHRLVALAEAALGGAIITALFALFTQLPPRLIGAALDNTPGRPLVPAIRGFATSVAADQTHQLLVTAAGLVVGAVVLGIAHQVLHLRGRFHHDAKPHEA